MQVFRLTTTSRLHYVLFLLTGIFASVFFAIVLLPKGTNQYVFIGVVIGLCFLGHWCAEKYSRQEVQLTISQDHLSVDWTKLPIFSYKKDKQIAWAEIATYVFQKEKDFDLFRLTLQGGEKLKFSISHDLDHQDSFHEFYQSFLSKVDFLQKQQPSGSHVTIEQGKTFYETPVGIGLAFLSAGVILFGIIFILLNQGSKPVKWGKLITSALTCLFYIQLVWTHNIKKKKRA